MRLRRLAATLTLLAGRALAEPPPPYPREWVDRAQAENSARSCMHLVYKRGCSALRKGRVTLDVELRPDGTVARFTEAENTIGREPRVVSRCLRRELPKWRFTPPGAASPALRLTLVFADRC